MSKSALEVHLNGDYDIRFVQHIESQLRQALAHCGFCQTGTTKTQEGTVIRYYQFAIALGDDTEAREG